VWPGITDGARGMSLLWLSKPEAVGNETLGRGRNHGSASGRSCWPCLGTRVVGSAASCDRVRVEKSYSSQSLTRQAIASSSWFDPQRFRPVPSALDWEPDWVACIRQGRWLQSCPSSPGICPGDSCSRRGGRGAGARHFFLLVRAPWALLENLGRPQLPAPPGSPRPLDGGSWGMCPRSSAACCWSRRRMRS
jgi:hypothetical protein